MAFVEIEAFFSGPFLKAEAAGALVLPDFEKELGEGDFDERAGE
jgi:hypothetical protein